MDSNITTFYKEIHTNYLLSLFETQSKRMMALDNSKMMLFYFIIAGIDFLKALPDLPIKISSLIDWIYSQQCFTDLYGGFRGGPYLGFDFHCSSQDLEFSSQSDFDKGHLVHTFSALVSLKLLGDDFSRVRRKHLFKYINECQNADGSFRATIDSFEADLRFLYSASVSCYLLEDLQAINKKTAIDFIFSCQNKDGAFGLRPREESHSGATYCAVASLAILGDLDDIPNKTKLIEFLVNRQVPWDPNREKGNVGGFQGRINKYPDSCYSFWNGATLKILGFEKLLNKESVQPYILNCQEIQKGGFKKFDFISNSDPIHTLHSMFGLSLLGFEDLPEIDPIIGIARKTK